MLFTWTKSDAQALCYLFCNNSPCCPSVLGIDENTEPVRLACILSYCVNTLDAFEVNDLAVYLMCGEDTQNARGIAFVTRSIDATSNFRRRFPIHTLKQGRRTSDNCDASNSE
jgi:hypothetical protein